MLHRPPREFGRDSSLWTLEMAAQVSFEQGLVEMRISAETIRATLARLLGVRWQREPNAGSPPRIPYTKEKKAPRPTDGGGYGRLRVGSGF